MPTATLARILYHHQLVKMGHRHFWCRELFWEIPTALFCAIIGGGIAQYFNLGYFSGSALVGMASWMGPRGIEIFLARFIERHLPKKKGGK